MLELPAYGPASPVEAGHDGPTSLARLVTYREEHAGEDESRRVWLFHSHAYFDHTQPEQVALARSFMELIRHSFSATRHLEVHSFFAAPAGPHPRGNFEVLFTRDILADYTAWLLLARPESVDVLIHPLTRSQLLDHTVRALWLGTPRPLDRQMLEAVDARLAAAGLSEERIIDGSKRH